MDTKKAYKPMTCDYCGRRIKTGHLYVRLASGAGHVHDYCATLASNYGCITPEEVKQTIIKHYRWFDGATKFEAAIDRCNQLAVIAQAIKYLPSKENPGPEDPGLF